MATPTDAQQMRATLRRHARSDGPTAAVHMALVVAADIFGDQAVGDAACAIWPDLRGSTSVPPLMGAAEAADALGMKATNLKRLSPPLLPVAIVSGRIPVYLASDVAAAKQRRDARREAQQRLEVTA